MRVENSETMKKRNVICNEAWIYTERKVHKMTLALLEYCQSLGFTYYELGNFEKARENLLEQGLVLYKKVPGKLYK